MSLSGIMDIQQGYPGKTSKREMASMMINLQQARSILSGDKFREIYQKYLEYNTFGKDENLYTPDEFWSELANIVSEFNNIAPITSYCGAGNEALCSELLKSKKSGQI